jgi:hypothetical protein
MTLNLTFWIPNLGIPILALIANVVVRWARGLPQSAVPDLILCFVVFDALVVIQHDDFQKFIRIDSLASAVEGLYVALLIGTLVIWFIMVTEIEHRIVACYAAHGTVLTLGGMMLLLASGILATMVVFLSVIPFAYQA